MYSAMGKVRTRAVLWLAILLAGGMGMGLSISRSILQAHGGRLWAAAKDGPGTIFHFSLPKYHEENASAGAAAV